MASRLDIVHEPTAGGDKPRPYNPEFVQRPPPGVGDGLVPSRVEPMHGPGEPTAGGDKPRPCNPEFVQRATTAEPWGR